MISPYLFLIGLELLNFAPFAGRVGFYHDDWSNLERCLSSGGLWNNMRQYAGLVADRPLEILHYPLLYAWGGFEPLRYQLAYLLFETAAACLLYSLLVRLLDSRRLALTAAALYVAYPNHAITHHWLGSSAQTVALLLLFASLLKHLDWLDTQKPGPLAASLGLFCAALLEYEIVAFMPLMLAARRPWRRSLAPFALPLVLVFLWRRFGVPFLAAGTTQRAVALSWTHAWDTYAAGLNSLTLALPRAYWDAAKSAGGGMLPIVLCATVVPALLWLGLTRVGGSPSSSRAGVWTSAAGAFVGGFLPYALSVAYTPTAQGIMARTSVAGSLAGALFFAWPLARAGWWPLVAVLSCFTLSNWQQSLQWARSWEVQREILGQISPKIMGLPQGSTVLVAGFPRFIGPEGRGSLVFDAHWDIGSALRITTGRFDLHANVVSERLRFHESEAVESFAGRVLRRYPYQNLYLYGHDRNALYKLGRGAPLSGAPRLEPVKL